MKKIIALALTVAAIAATSPALAEPDSLQSLYWSGKNTSSGR